MTALAGCGAGERGRTQRTADRAARKVVVELAHGSDQTYDLALAILFLARCQQGRRGEADPFIQTLGRRLAGGDQEGIWTYTVPASGQEPEPAPGRSRRGERRKGARRNAFFAGRVTTRIRSSHCSGCGRRDGMDLTRTVPWNRSISILLVADQRWPLGLPAGDGGNGFDDVCRLDGAGDRRLAARAGRAANGPGSRSCPGRRPPIHRGLEGRRPGCPSRQRSIRHLLPLVARAGLRGSWIAFAGRL